MPTWPVLEVVLSAIAFEGPRSSRILGAGTLLDVLRRRAAEHPDRLAFRFLADGEAEAGGLTFGRLERRAAVLGRILGEAGAAGERALLLYPSGLDFVTAFLGCLWAQAVAVPAAPPRPGRAEDQRLLAIAADARPRLVLTTAALAGRAERLAAGCPDLAGAAVLATDALDLDGAAPAPLPELGAGDLAFLQYTSGSTATPKGVAVTHGNLVHNEQAIQQSFSQDEESVIVGWLPLFHDMGLIGNVLQPLYAGASCILMSPAAFLQSPVRWLRAVSRYRATTSGGPNFAYDLCVRRIGPAERAGLDLASWKVAFNGAEPVRAATLERFAAAFAGCGFRRQAFVPCYGLAEATLLVAGGLRDDGPEVVACDAAALGRGLAMPPVSGAVRELVACGAPAAGQEVRIVDAETGRPCGAGEVGEVWVAGPSVAAGYWGRPAETAAAFGAVPLEGAGAGPYLRTGDLGFLHRGELVLAGRAKDLIILRGRNLYPQDVELTAEQSHPALRAGGCAAFGVEDGDGERLVVAAEVERRREAEAGEAAAALRRAVAEEHEVQVHEVVLLRAGELPRTTSGKVRRRACREAWLAGTLTGIVGAAGRAGAAGEGEEEKDLGKEGVGAVGAATGVEAPGGVLAPAADRAALLVLPVEERRAAMLAALGVLAARAL
ncbi:MAG TPA: fatty acyl-AMP ligase, partial [Thermoanaerobaculia bacterium]|nr:fatty acyl-AMP ligase [Thermoanaerobaculia bacterium]